MVDVNIGTKALTEQQRTERLKQLEDVMALMKPAVAADGGDLNLVSADVETGVVQVELSGACSSCALNSVTLVDGVSRILTQRLDWVTKVTT